MMNTDPSLPIDHTDLENEGRVFKTDVDDEKTSPKDTVSWLASQPKLNAKSKSGYILFSAEVRKRIMNENPEAGFGEVSKIVGIEWKKLTDEQKRQYEVRAQYIADERAKAELLTPTSRILQPGQIRVFHCKWQMCDFQFDSFNGLYEHVKTSHTSLIVDGDNQYVCLWTSCLKYRKEGKPFPSLPRLHRHIKEKHLPSAGKAIYPNQKGKNFFVFIDPPQSPESNKPGSHNNTTSFGSFIHQPYGVATPDAIPCTVAIPYPSTNAVTTSVAHPQQHPTTSSTTVHTNSSIPAQNSGTTQYIIQQPGSMTGSVGGAHGAQGTAVQYVQATINGSTVYVPAGQQYQTIIVNQVPQGSSIATPQQHIVVHQSAPHSQSQVVQQATPQQPQVTSGYHQQAGVQQTPAGTQQIILQQAGGTNSHATMNGVLPGTSYAAHQAQSSVSTTQPQHSLAGTSSSTASQPIIDPGRTIVQAPPKPPEPVFVPPPNSIQVKRVMHSETYLRYIESLSNDKQRTISKWDKNLLATAKNTQPTKRLPYDWVKGAANGSKPRDEEVVKALWKLRDQLLESTLDIARESELNF
uniref:Uncharacterized protein n=1 Tax=Acrobeloides nanus TaxID=290746 RepID=A0A914CFV0_9BILA